ncbi:response regulator [Nereida sp. MMG025]|uniref:response regulator n=1 Tax=Nereida sp. MMG025 TaxID=2909981 RepID=UPI001F170613|nr:response regulator [Nereida sp. MMG025]MCF6444057.1 response regulator [Nereida sp. MMG025]
MPEFTDPLFNRPATPQRPLLGQTILVVEDSRFACEALRLMCLRSGARIRMADCLGSARRHLRVYRPSVTIVDIGLPDGSGTDLLRDLAAASPRVEVILGTSGDTGAEAKALAAGADGFLEKPLRSLVQFQQAVLAHMPADRRPAGPRLVEDEVIEPDHIAYQNDMAHIAEVLTADAESQTLDYIAQFTHGVARTAQDSELQAAVEHLSATRKAGQPVPSALSQLAGLVQERLTSRAAI